MQAILADSILTGTASFSLEPPESAELETRLARMTAEGLPWIVAEADGKIAGYALADWFRPRPGYRFTVEDSIYVDANHRGRGVGKDLLKTVVAASRDRGFRQMIAVIGDVENTASIRLHKACGFHYAGVLKDVGFKFDRWLDTIYMQRAL